MFDRLLGHRFIKKCKSLLKITMTRLQAARKKKTAVQRYLKNDIADLLRNDLDYNAYGRAEGLLVEMTVTRCYELIEQFIECISTHISTIHKQRECPQECKEAIPSLMFAAARFAELPELRDLRNMFTQKYGNSLDPFVNQELVEKLKQQHLTKDMKIRLMWDVAKEFSIDWDSKALEQKLYAPPASEQTQLQNLDQWHESEDEDIPVRDNEENWRKQEDDENKGKPLDDELQTTVPYASIPPPYVKYENATNSEPADDDRKPRSVRRKPLKPPPCYGNASITSPTKTRPRQGGSRRSFQNSDVDDDDDDDQENVERNRRGDHPRRRSGSVIPSAKTSSFPGGPNDALGGHARATSLDSDMRNQDGHVHPKLPDYEDLAARVAALQGI